MSTFGSELRRVRAERQQAEYCEAAERMLKQFAEAGVDQVIEVSGQRESPAVYSVNVGFVGFAPSRGSTKVVMQVGKAIVTIEETD